MLETQTEKVSFLRKATTFLFIVGIFVAVGISMIGSGPVPETEITPSLLFVMKNKIEDKEKETKELHAICQLIGNYSRLDSSTNMVIALTIQQIIQKYPNLTVPKIVGLISWESGFQPGIISHAGAVGLMQVMPATARLLGFGGADLKDPVKNLQIGCKLLAAHDADHGYEKALACYNAGPRVLTWRNWPEETKHFVPGVMALVQSVALEWSA